LHEITNNQDTITKQAPITNHRTGFIFCLVIGIWLLVIVWLLEIGNWLFHVATLLCICLDWPLLSCYFR